MVHKLKQKGREAYAAHRNFVIYIIIGLFGLILDYGIFFILSNFAGIDPYLSNLASTVVSVGNNFVWNWKFNFRTEGNSVRRAVTFYAVAASGFVITTLLLALGNDVLGISSNWMKAFAIFVVTIWQYNLNKFITFKPN